MRFSDPEEMPPDPLGADRSLERERELDCNLKFLMISQAATVVSLGMGGAR